MNDLEDELNLRDLEYLVAIDELRHFGKAAERCHVSQPTLSGQLKKLEEYLGVSLVERSNRQVLVTEVGRDIVARARVVLAGAQEIEDVALSHRDPLSGRMRLGLIPTVAPYLLPLAMGSLRSELLDMQFQLQESQTHVLTKQLHDGELDLLLLALNVPGTEGFEEIELYDEPFYLAVPKGHALAEKSAIHHEDLSGETVLLLEDGHCLRGQALEICSTHQAREASHFRATSLETLRQMVRAGSNVTLVPELAVPLDHDEQVRYLPFVDPVPARKIGLLYRRSSSRHRAHAAIAKIVRRCFEERRSPSNV